MALPVVFDLIPPSIVVSQTSSIYGIGLPNADQDYTFGYVRQVNYNTAMNIYAGQRILYRQTEQAPQIFIGSEPYFIIDENKIFLIEPPSAPL